MTKVKNHVPDSKVLQGLIEEISIGRGDKGQATKLMDKLYTMDNNALRKLSDELNSDELNSTVMFASTDHRIDKAIQVIGLDVPVGRGISQGLGETLQKLGHRIMGIFTTKSKTAASVATPKPVVKEMEQIEIVAKIREKANSRDREKNIDLTEIRLTKDQESDVTNLVGNAQKTLELNRHGDTSITITFTGSKGGVVEVEFRQERFNQSRFEIVEKK